MEIKYIVRRNHFYVDTDFFRLGLATQFVGVFEISKRQKQE